MKREPVRPEAQRARARIGTTATRGARLLEALTAVVLLVLGLFGTGCTPTVGSSCELSTDCGTTGQLVCDTSEIGGYCTVVDCLPNECPDNAGCILFNFAIPGCGISRQDPSRISQPFCMATCSSDSDCRAGYICANPTESPWYAWIQDSNWRELVCLPEPVSGFVGLAASSALDTDAAVCQQIGPTFDADFPPIPDASSADGADGNESGPGDAASHGDGD
jgi:hypothetical protein